MSEIGTIHLFIPRVERYRAPMYELIGTSDRSQGLVVTVNEPLPSEIEGPTSYRVIVVPSAREGLGLAYHPGWTLNDRATSPGDVLVVLGNPRYLAVPRVWRQARRHGMPIVSWGIGIMPHQRPIRHAIRLEVFRRADAALLYSDYEVEVLRSRIGKPGKTVTATNNTIDRRPILDSIAATTLDDIRAVRSGLGVRADEPVFIFVGRIHAKSRLDVLIKAVALIPSDQRRFKIGIIGDGPLKNAWQHATQQNGLDRTIFWHGPLHAEDELAPWFLAATAYVYPGSVGLGAHHALAYGVPVVSAGDQTALTAEGRSVVHGYNGLHYAGHDADSLARLITATNQMTWDTLTAGALETAQAFSIKGSARRFVDAAIGASRFHATRVNDD